MNRRGFLLGEETLKIVIAVICIIFLVYFLTSLYYKNKSDEQLELAKASLEHIVEGINANAGEVEIYNPNGWVLSSWPHEVLKGIPPLRKKVMDIPNSCKNLGWENCLCICKDTTFLNLEGNDCDKNGICVQNDFSVEGNTIAINPVPLKLTIDKSSGTIK